MSDAFNPANDQARQSEFVRLLTAHQQDIYLYLRSLVLDPDEASEILQDSNLVLWEKRGQFEIGTNFRAWAFQIARYKLLQHQAQRHRAGVCFSDALVDELVQEVSGGDEALGDLIDELRRCVAMLPARDRELIGRRYAAAGHVPQRRGGPRPPGALGLQGREPHPQGAVGVHLAGKEGDGFPWLTLLQCRLRAGRKRGQVQFAGTARRVLRHQLDLSPFSPPGGNDRLKPELQTELRALADAACDGAAPAARRHPTGGNRSSATPQRSGSIWPASVWTAVCVGSSAKVKLRPSPFSLPRPPARLPLSGAAVEPGIRAAVELPHQLDAPESESLIPPIIIDTSPTLFSPRRAFPFSVGGWLFSYAAATVITGMAILGAWVYTVSHDYQIAALHNSREPSARPARRGHPAEGRVRRPDHGHGRLPLGRSDPSPRGAAVPLGGKYALSSGLVEIAYQTGAKVILQGPCTYEVDSARGGFLSLGKLTARVEKSEIRNPKSEAPNPQSLIPNPLFLRPHPHRHRDRPGHRVRRRSR